LERTSRLKGLSEDTVFLGDRFTVGSAEVVVTQIRLPCYKLGVRFESDDIIKRFLASARTGFYLAVTREGMVAAGDEITLVGREPNSISVAEMTRLFVTKQFSAAEVALTKRALSIAALPDSWKDYFRERAELLRA
jgi:MOSC domain-containing protein YiiM